MGGQQQNAVPYSSSGKYPRAQKIAQRKMQGLELVCMALHDQKKETYQREGEIRTVIMNIKSHPDYTVTE